MGIGFATRNIPRLIDPLPGGAKLIDAIEFVVGWSRANSLWPLVYGTACCAMEMMSTGSSRHDWARFGVEVARATPRQADLIILAGTIVGKMGSRLVTLYEQMPGPKYVIAMGSCAISGGPFIYDSYTVVKGGDRLIPVDVYVPGCPPRPEALLFGIMQLQKKIRAEGRRNPWQMGEVNTAPPVDAYTECRQAWAEREKKRKVRQKVSEGPGAARAARPRRLKPPEFPEIPPRPSRAHGLSAQELLRLVKKAVPGTGKIEAGGRGGSVELYVTPEDYVSVVKTLKEHPGIDCRFLVMVTAVDRLERFEVVVQVLSVDHGHQVLVRCPVARNNPELESLAPVFPGAAWHEREVYDLFGIRFRNHPDPRRIFLEEDFAGHPLRKDFTHPDLMRRPY